MSALRSGISIVVAFAFLGQIQLRAADKKMPPRYEEAKVLSQDLNSSQSGVYSMPIGGAVAAVPIYRRSNVVEVETAAYRYRWAETGRQAIILPVGEIIYFWREGNFFVVSDSKGKKHKFGLIGQTLIERNTDK